MHKLITFISLITVISVSAMDQEGNNKITSKYKNGWQPTNCLLQPEQMQHWPIFSAKRAIESGDEKMLQTLLDAQTLDFTPKPGEPTSTSFALLKCAIKMRSPKMCEQLLKAGADANAWSIEEAEGNNILSFACRRGIQKRNFSGIDEICALLLSYGARINKRCIVEAEEEGGYLLPLFVKHILMQPHGNDDPNLYIHSYAGLKPIYVKNVRLLLQLVEEDERPEAFGGLEKSMQQGKPYLMHGLIRLFQEEKSYLYFPATANKYDEAQMWADIKEYIIFRPQSLPAPAENSTN